MFRFILLALFTISMAQAHASHLEDVCSQAYQDGALFNPPLFAKDLISRRDDNNNFILENVEGNLLFSSEEKINDVLVTEDKIWVLNDFDLQELTLTGSLLGHYSFESNHNSKRQGMTFAHHGDTLYIAQGMGGLSAFDLKTHKVIWNTDFSEIKHTMAVSVTTDADQYVYAIMATTAEEGFSGFVTLDPKNGKIMNKATYGQDWGVIDITPRASWYNNSLVLNNGGWIHQISKKQLTSKKAIKPRWVAHVIPAKGPINQHYMMTVGGFFFEQKNLIGCGTFLDNVEGKFILKSALFKTAMPN